MVRLSMVYTIMQVSFQQRYLILPGFPVGERVVVSSVSPVRKEYNGFMTVKNYEEGKKLPVEEEEKIKRRRRSSGKNEEKEKKKEQRRE